MDDSLNLIPVTLSEYIKSLNHEHVAFYIEKLTKYEIIFVYNLIIH
jgi:hypothetical protein